jgi:hypothetical protein
VVCIVNILDEARRVQSLLAGIPIWGSRAEENDMQRMHRYLSSVLLVSHLFPRWASRPAIVFKTIAVKMLEREMKERGICFTQVATTCSVARPELDPSDHKMRAFPESSRYPS